MNIRDTALNYLTYRDRSVKEMRDHLAKKYEQEDVDNEIESLVELGYLDDIRFAGIFLSSSLSKNRGLLRIRRELKNKGVSDFDIEDAFAAFEEENDIDLREYQREQAFAMAERFLERRDTDAKVLNKLAGKLKNAGYENSIMYEVTDYYRKNK